MALHLFAKWPMFIAARAESDVMPIPQESDVMPIPQESDDMPIPQESDVMPIPQGSDVRCHRRVK